MATYMANQSALIAPDQAIGLPGTLDSSVVAAGTDGKKVIKAGTPVGAKANWLTTDQSAAVTKLSEFTAAEGEIFAGVVADDVDLTAGDKEATILFANVYLRQKMLDTTVVAALQAVAGKTTGVTLVNR